MRALDVGFLLVLGLAVAATSQITGALLVFALLVAPPAAAQALTPRPGLEPRAERLLRAASSTWVGLGISYFSIYPLGFFVTSLAFGLYLLAQGVRRVAVRFSRGARPPEPVPVV